MCVLLVEDEPLIREIMSESLRGAGYDVIEVESGVQAIGLIRNPPRDFSILVTDFHMPGLVDGEQVAVEMRQAHPHLPVVIMSGRPEVFRPEWHTERGYRLLQKPYRPSTLVSLVRSLVG